MNLFGRGSKSSPEQIETVIGASANVRGTLRSDGGVRVDGAFEGLIETAGNVVVGEHGRVVADIHARNITVGGAVKGDIDALGRLEILSTGVVYGDVRVQSVMIDEGGQFHGISRMRGLAHPALAAPTDELDVVLGEVGDESVSIILDGPIEATARQAVDDDEPVPIDVAPQPSEVSRPQASAPVAEPATPAPAPSAKPAPPPSNSTARTAAPSAPPTARKEPVPAAKAPAAKGDAAKAAAPQQAAAAAGHSTNGASDDNGLDFDVDTIEMDIEPVIPDVPPTQKPASGAGRRSSASGDAGR